MCTTGFRAHISSLSDGGGWSKIKVRFSGIAQSILQRVLQKNATIII